MIATVDKKEAQDPRPRRRVVVRNSIKNIQNNVGRGGESGLAMKFFDHSVGTFERLAASNSRLKLGRVIQIPDHAG
jgi:hypothetical protein